MKDSTSVIAVFADHFGADTAVKAMADAGIEKQHLSVIGKGYHTEEKVIGFYNMGDRMKFWGKRGAFRGRPVGLVCRRHFLDYPRSWACGGARVPRGHADFGCGRRGGCRWLSVLGAALYSSGIPKDSIIAYDTAIKADGFLVTVHGPAEELARAKAILAAGNPIRLDETGGLKAA